MRIALLILTALFVGCGGTSTIVVEADTRAPFVLDPSQPFVIELGRGSGQSGLDIVKIDETGAVQLSRSEGRPHPETAALQLSSTALATLVGSVHSHTLTSLGRSYSDPRIADGTQWVLWIEQPPLKKSTYFNNAFPVQITAFASDLDGLLHNAGLGTAKWTALSAPAAASQQQALWARMER